MEEIVSASIQAAATVLAAIIGVTYAGKIVKKTTEKQFFNYADKNHNLHKVMRKAKKSITVIANCGDKFLKNYCNNLIHYIKKGVQINFLLLDIKNYTYMDIYTTGKNNADYDALEKSLQILAKLKRQNPDKVAIKVFNYVLTTSYIGIDLEQNLFDNTWPETTLIQVMPYQFNTCPEECPITYITPREKKQFQSVVDSIFEIWDCGETVNLDDYLAQVAELKTPKVNNQ